MLPAIVFPLHDPQGAFFNHLNAVRPLLGQVFSAAYVGVTPPTLANCAGAVRRLEEDAFFRAAPAPIGEVGEQFTALYRRAALESPPEMALHLCFIDRLEFILQTGHRDPFLADIRALGDLPNPVIFCRSEWAWRTHPQNYREIEQFATRMGELLLGRALDFAWCHLAVRAGQLAEALTFARRRDLSMMAEIALALSTRIHMRPVDWLAWEDPFLFDQDAEKMKCQREQSPDETRKRLAYVLPTLEVIKEWAVDGGQWSV